MHIYLQWDSRVTGIPSLPPQRKKKKKDSQEYKTPWPGNNWSSLGYLPKTLNIKASPIRSQLHAKTTDKSPNKSKQGPKLFLFFGRQNRFCFLRIILRVETISMLSSNETLSNMQCTRAHSHGTLRKHICPVSSSAPAATLLITCTQGGQPLSFLCQV